MVSILKRVVGPKGEARRSAESMHEGRALEGRELERVVGGFGLGLPVVGPQALSLSAGPKLRAGSVLGPAGLLPSSVAPGAGVVGAGTLSGGFSSFTGGGSDRGEP